MKKNEINKILNLLWEDTSTLNFKDAIKVKVFRQTMIAGFKKKISSKPYQKLTKRELFDLIIILQLKPLDTVSSLVMAENYIKENGSVLMPYRGDDGWYLSFRTDNEALINNSVLLVIKDNQGTEIIREILKLEEDDIDDVWEFKYYLPQNMKLDKSYAIEVRYLD